MGNLRARFGCYSREQTDIRDAFKFVEELLKFTREIPDAALCKILYEYYQQADGTAPTIAADCLLHEDILSKVQVHRGVPVNAPPEPASDESDHDLDPQDEETTLLPSQEPSAVQKHDEIFRSLGCTRSSCSS